MKNEQERGIEAAQEVFEAGVLDATIRDLSKGDMRFLEAMLNDQKESRLSDIAARMGVSNGYAAKYKSRLLAQGVIEEYARGIMGIEMPGLRKYLERRLS